MMTLLLSLCLLVVGIILQACGHPRHKDGDLEKRSDELAHLENLLDKMSLLDQKLNAFDQRMNSLDERLIALDQRVTNHMGKLTDKMDSLISRSKYTVLNDLRAVCAELDEVPEKISSLNKTTPTPDAEKPTIPFRLKRVRSRETHNSYLVTLEYEASSKPFVAYSKGFGSAFVHLQEQEMNKVEYEVPKSPDTDRPIFNFIFPRSYFILALKLNNTQDVMEIPDYDFKILQGRDITFQPGKRVMINVTIDTDADPETFYENDARSKIFIKSESRDDVVNSFSGSSRLHPDYVSPVQLEPIDYGGSKGHRHATVLLKSSVDVEGIVELIFSVGFNCSINCLLEEIHSSYSIKVYRNDRKGPFPNGFIGFVHDDFRSPDFTQFYCDLRAEDCTIYCQVVGDHVSTINLYRQQSSAGMQTSHHVLANATGDYWGIAFRSIQNGSMDDAGDYMCTASSQTHQITQMLQLRVFKSPKIDQTLSAVTKLSMGLYRQPALQKVFPHQT